MMRACPAPHPPAASASPTTLIEIVQARHSRIVRSVVSLYGGEHLQKRTEHAEPGARGDARVAAMSYHFTLDIIRVECVNEELMEWGKDEMHCSGSP